MRFAVDIRPLTDRHMTGVGFALLETLHELLPMAPEHHFFLFASGSEETLARIPKFSAPNATVVTKLFPNRVLFPLSSLKNSRALDKSLPADVDAWWFPNWTATATAKPYLLTVHDVSYVHFPDFFHWKERILRRIARPDRIAKKAARILTVSPTTARDVMHAWDIPQEKLTVTTLGVNHEHFLPREQSSDRSFRAMYDLNRPYFLSLATREPRKNLPGIIEGYARYRQHGGVAHPLVLIGASGWKNRDILESIRACPYRNEILSIGYVPAKHRPALLRGAETLLFPSFFEGFGLPALEALACGTPVITTSATAVHDLFGKATLSVDAHNAEDIAQALLLLSHPTESESIRTSMKETGLTIAKHFTWKKTAEDTLAALLSLRD